MLTILDRHIIAKFLKTFFFMIGAIMLIAVIFDISERIDDFVKRSAPLDEIIIDYYLNFIIFYGNLFSSLMIFISVIFFTSNMAGKSEIVAILAGGVSFYRLLVPYMIAATILAFGSLYLNHWVIPKANKNRVAFEEAYFRHPFRNLNKNIHKQVVPGQIMYFESYNVEKNVGYKFSLEQWDDNKLKYKILSEYSIWDSVEQRWMVFNYTERFYEKNGERIVKGERLDSAYAFTPLDFSRRASEYTTQMMNYDELKAFIEDEKIKGSDEVPFHYIEMYQRTSYPFAAYVLTLIGVSMSSRRVRGGIGFHLAVGLVIAVMYIVVMKIATVFATNSGLDPMYAVWIPNLVFAIFSVYMIWRAPK
jgi:lipopolysaccharide export system permease protein